MSGYNTNNAWDHLDHAMQPYETSATIENAGQLRLDDVPFPTGTRVAVTIRPQLAPREQPSACRQLFAALDQARNVASVGALRREELYERADIR